MAGLRIFAITAAVAIALWAWWVPHTEGGGCPGGGACAEGYRASRTSAGPDWFYGGSGAGRAVGARPEARERAGDGNETHCRPDHHGSSTDAGNQPPQACEDVRARFF